MSRRVLEVLQPEQLEIALRALKELQERSQAIDRQWQMRIERREYQAQLAQRRREWTAPGEESVRASLKGERSEPAGPLGRRIHASCISKLGVTKDPDA